MCWKVAARESLCTGADDAELSKSIGILVKLNTRQSSTHGAGQTRTYSEDDRKAAQVNCTRCDKPIEKNQPYARTKRGAHHFKAEQCVTKLGAEQADPQPSPEWIKNAAKELVDANADRGRTYDNSPDCLETSAIIAKHFGEHAGSDPQPGDGKFCPECDDQESCHLSGLCGRQIGSDPQLRQSSNEEVIVRQSREISSLKADVEDKQSHVASLSSYIRELQAEVEVEKRQAWEQGRSDSAKAKLDPIMTNKAFLEFVRNRLQYVHGESPESYLMHRLKRIADTIQGEEDLVTQLTEAGLAGTTLQEEVSRNSDLSQPPISEKEKGGAK